MNQRTRTTVSAAVAVALALVVSAGAVASTPPSDPPPPGDSTAGGSVPGGSTTAPAPEPPELTLAPTALASTESARLAVTMRGLEAFVAAGGDPNAPALSECPILPASEVESLMSEHGYALRTSDYAVTSYYKPAALTQALSCGPHMGNASTAPEPNAPYAVRLEAVTISGVSEFAAIVEDLGAAATTADVVGPGDELAGSCGNSSNNPAMDFCNFAWHADGVVLAFFVVGPTGAVDEVAFQTLFTDMVPSIVTNLWDQGAAARDAEPAPADSPEAVAAAAGAANADAATLSVWYQLGAPAARTALDATFVIDGPGYRRILQSEQALIDGGFTVAPNPDDPYMFTVESVTLLDGSPGTVATVTICAYATDVTTGPEGPDESPPTAYRYDYTMYLDGGTWKLWQYALIEGFERSPTCPGAPDATVPVPPTTLAPAP